MANPSKLTVGEVARILDVSTATIRAWDTCGKLVPQGRTAGNRRYYTQEQVDTFVANNPQYKYMRIASYRVG